jgi:tRNA-dihydrouridine synthase
MRKHAAWYVKGIRGAAAIRNQINQAQTRDELLGILYDFIQPLEAEKQAI